MAGEHDQRVQLMTLREYRSEAGRRYFRGWLGDAVVLVFEDANAAQEYGAVATWNAYVVPRKAKAPAGADKATRPARRAGRRITSQLAPGSTDAPASRSHPGLEDPLPF